MRACQGGWSWRGCGGGLGACLSDSPTCAGTALLQPGLGLSLAHPAMPRRVCRGRREAEEKEELLHLGSVWWPELCPLSWPLQSSPLPSCIPALEESRRVHPTLGESRELGCGPTDVRVAGLSCLRQQRPRSACQTDTPGADWKGVEWRLLFAQLGWECFLVLPVWFNTPSWGLGDPKESLIWDARLRLIII